MLLAGSSWIFLWHPVVPKQIRHVWNLNSNRDVRSSILTWMACNNSSRFSYHADFWSGKGRYRPEVFILGGLPWFMIEGISLASTRNPCTGFLRHTDLVEWKDLVSSSFGFSNHYSDSHTVVIWTHVTKSEVYLTLLPTHWLVSSIKIHLGHSKKLLFHELLKTMKGSIVCDFETTIQNLGQSLSYP